MTPTIKFLLLLGNCNFAPVMSHKYLICRKSDYVTPVKGLTARGSEIIGWEQLLNEPRSISFHQWNKHYLLF